METTLLVLGIVTTVVWGGFLTHVTCEGVAWVVTTFPQLSQALAAYGLMAVLLVVVGVSFQRSSRVVS